MKNLYAAAAECIHELEVLDIKIGNLTDITVNYRAEGRWGQCKKRGSVYSININHRLLFDDVPDLALKETLLHELIHTCDNCMTHTGEWLRLVNKVNAYYGYNIKRTESAAEKGITEEQQTRGRKTIQCKCKKCGKIVNRFRECEFTKHPYLYTHSKCGGSFERI